jgi:putative nucleotidyltransferase with HDIG domain
MNSISKHKWLFNRDIIYKILIFIATVTVIVSFLPQDDKFNYQFDINKPWKYGLLQASFDFPIYKSDAQIKEEQDSLMESYQPYLSINNNVEKLAIEKFKEDYNKTLKYIIPNYEYFTQIEKMLKEMYKLGIISGSDMSILRGDSIKTFRLVNNTTASSHNVSQLTTVKEAYEKIMSSTSFQLIRTLLQKCNLNNYLTPNVEFDKERSDIAKKDLLSTISGASGYVISGQKIIDRGEIVNEGTYNILQSLKKEWSKKSDSPQEIRMTIGGQILFVSIFILCFMIYLELFRKDYYQHKGGLTLLFALVMFFPVLTSLLVDQNLFTVYIIPFAMVPIIVRVFLDSRTAFMIVCTIIMLSSITLRYPYEFILLQVVASMIAIYSLRELSQRSQLIRTAFFIFVGYALLYFSLELINENDLTRLNTRMYLYFMINGVLLLFAYPLLFVLEKIFGFTSNVTLVELSNINNKILREMSEVAPGTFQHSLQVANLASAAANRIGAKSQLVRTGALYHDIGKTVNPALFTENQSGVNPHENLTYQQSAQVVLNHVTDGLKLAEKHNLPQVIKDFISTHHGKGVTKYFYISCQNENPDEVIDKSIFTYPGPNPFTKEQAIMMMADSVEAASRSMPEYTEESISNLVDKIVDSQVNEGYFKECPITFMDIANVKSVFKEKLKTMYHARISYPELKK